MLDKLNLQPRNDAIVNHSYYNIYIAHDLGGLLGAVLRSGVLLVLFNREYRESGICLAGLTVYVYYLLDCMSACTQQG